MIEKVKEIDYFKSKYPSLCTRGSMLLSPHKSCIECNESLTYFHHGYKILVNVTDWKNLKCICLKHEELIKVILIYTHTCTEFRHVAGVA